MKLVFVYNAKAGFLNGMMDSVHKAVSPDTYDCQLCAVTHGFFTMDKTWRNWLKSLKMETAFYHRPDFREAYPSARDWPLPLIALDRDGVLEPVIPAAEMKSLATVDALVAALEARLPV